MIQDSGTRREFETGAVRDISEGKGRCDLLPLDVIASIYYDANAKNTASTFYMLDEYVKTGDCIHLYNIIENFSFECFHGLDTAIIEVSKHFEEGCKKYGDRNWQKGIPIHCYIDSAIRHYLKFLRGDDDERHDRAFLWNLLCCLWTQRNKPELNDLPFAEKEN